jgi:hypothetical protein
LEKEAQQPKKEKEVEEILDPSKYYENRCKEITQLKSQNA